MLEGILRYAIPISLGIIAVWLLAKLIGRIRPVKPQEEEPRKKTFLEEALEAEVERPKHFYSWHEFQKDLHDATMSFEAIYEKYGGVFPQKPEDPPPSAVVPTQGFQGPQASVCYYGPPGIQGELPRGASGMQGLLGAHGTPGPGGPPQHGVGGLNGPDGRCPDPKTDARMKELQEWFKKRGDDVPLKNLVPPPPAPHTVIHKIYTRGRR
jgi:hypothetical protein